MRVAAEASAPASNTRSKTAARAAPSRRSTRPSRLMRPTKQTRSTSKSGTASAVVTKRNNRRLKRWTKRIAKMESEVHQAMAVMDAETGKLLNYNQSMRHPKYKGKWQTSANEFGLPANGVGGRIKGTNTIKFIRMQDVPKDRIKDVT